MVTSATVRRRSVVAVVRGPEARLTGDIFGGRRDVFLGQVLREGRHDRVLALAEAVRVQRVGDVVGVLAADVRVLVGRAAAIPAVAGGTGLGLRRRGADRL